MENTPGPGGYVIAWAVSVTVFAVLFVGVASIQDGLGLGSAIGAVFVYGAFIACFSTPFAAVGIPAVHLLCRRVRSQWVHVLTAGFVGLLPTVFFAGLLQGAGGRGWFLLVPLATAIGRWSVVPLVSKRRGGCYHPRPGGLPGSSMGS